MSSRSVTAILWVAAITVAIIAADKLLGASDAIVGAVSKDKTKAA